MNNYEFNVNLYEKMKITVVAENEEEARRILKDTLDSITAVSYTHLTLPTNSLV